MVTVKCAVVSDVEWTGGRMIDDACCSGLGDVARFGRSGTPGTGNGRKGRKGWEPQRHLLRCFVHSDERANGLNGWSMHVCMHDDATPDGSAFGPSIPCPSPMSETRRVRRAAPPGGHHRKTRSPGGADRTRMALEQNAQQDCNRGS